MIKIALSFDDGRKDNYRIAKEILEPLEIPATFNITIGYVEKKDNIQKPSDHEPMSLEELQWLGTNSLFEIASHGYEHNNELNNLVLGANELRRVLNIPEKAQIGLVSPESKFDIDRLPEYKKTLEKNNIAYIRVGKRFNRCVIIKKIIRKINRKINIPKLYSWVYKDSDIKETDCYLLYSAGVIKDNKLDEIIKLINDAINNKKSYIICFHSILKPDEPFYNDLFTWDYADFYKLCKYLKQLEEKKQIKICQTKDLLNNKNETL